MIRTQVYLTKTEKKTLAQLSKQTGQSQSELIREAIDMLSVALKKKADDRLKCLRASFGMWKDRTDLDEFFTNLRKEGDRKF